MPGSWVTTITAVYGEDDVERATQFFAARPRDTSLRTVEWEGAKVTIVDDYGTDSKYGPVRPAVSALHEIFDPVADSEYYEPWPDELELRTEWREANG